MLLEGKICSILKRWVLFYTKNDCQHSKKFPEMKTQPDPVLDPDPKPKFLEIPRARTQTRVRFSGNPKREPKDSNILDPQETQ